VNAITPGGWAETGMMAVEKSGSSTSRAPTMISAAKAMTMGQRLRLRFDFADSSNESRNIFSSLDERI
jgi:hypothetical protein